VSVNTCERDVMLSYLLTANVLGLGRIGALVARVSFLRILIQAWISGGTGRWTLCESSYTRIIQKVRGVVAERSGANRTEKKPQTSLEMSQE
jgi:hypothetical protein